MQTCLGGVACIESLCSRLASDLACCDRKVHTTNGIAEIHAHHSCITRDDNAIANELRHHLQATFRNNVTRVFNELATTDDRSDLGAILEVLEHLIDRDVLLDDFGHRSNDTD